MESKTNRIEEEISLFEYIPLYKEVEQSYRYYEIGGIPILELNCFCRVSPEDNTIEEFIRDSKKMKEKDTIIIDLRNNIGGSMNNVKDWYRGFTGQRLKEDMISVGLYTNTSIALSKNKFETKENEKEEIKSQCVEAISEFENKNYFPGWSPVKYEEHLPPENKVKVYILVDKGTSSAAEFLAYYLRKLENVTIIGTNTNGCFLTGNCNSAFLPNSRIPLHISHKIYLSEDFNNIDGIGLLPDFWVKPDQSLDRIVKYINKNE